MGVRSPRGERKAREPGRMGGKIRSEQPSSRDRSTRKKLRQQRGRKSLGQIIFETSIPRIRNRGFDTRKEHNERRGPRRVLPEHVSAFHARLTLASDSIGWRTLPYKGANLCCPGLAWAKFRYFENEIKLGKEIKLGRKLGKFGEEIENEVRMKFDFLGLGSSCL